MGRLDRLGLEASRDRASLVDRDEWVRDKEVGRVPVRKTEWVDRGEAAAEGQPDRAWALLAAVADALRDQGAEAPRAGRRVGRRDWDAPAVAAARWARATWERTGRLLQMTALHVRQRSGPHETAKADAQRLGQGEPVPAEEFAGFGAKAGERLA
jgi:hypothetical protein